MLAPLTFHKLLCHHQQEKAVLLLDLVKNSCYRLHHNAQYLLDTLPKTGEQ